MTFLFCFACFVKRAQPVHRTFLKNPIILFNIRVQEITAKVSPDGIVLALTLSEIVQGCNSFLGNCCSTSVLLLLNCSCQSSTAAIISGSSPTLCKSFVRKLKNIQSFNTLFLYYSLSYVGCKHMNLFEPLRTRNILARIANRVLSLSL